MENKQQRVNLVLPDGLSSKLAVPLRWIALAAIAQTVLVVYLVFLQPAPKYDAKFLTLTDSILDQDARLAQVEQENKLLFRLLRNESEQHGVIPDETVLPNPALVPLPIPQKIIGETLGDSP